ncbi:hypothetical protein DAEQUDRAFT_731852 [Daedalea quercina L-15889]|uniref:RRM domain-containing protein n=1 Tax=Daedalea quercina L-15889 TaxID=1314783 RepID=A0A165M1E1_9APHY|nr:hypothetical protein DAEQUDRAFT_731852 [Daedalea quercina L-15889]
MLRTGKVLVTDICATLLRSQRHRNVMHEWKCQTSSAFITLPQRRCVQTQTAESTVTAISTVDSDPSTGGWTPTAFGAQSKVRDTFGLSLVYLPGPRLQGALSKDEDEEDEERIPDKDAAVDDEGNAAGKTLLITRLPQSATVEDVTNLLEKFGECVVRMHVSPSGGNRGFTHITFRRLRDAQAVLREHNAEPFHIGEQQLRVLYGHGNTTSQATLFERPKTHRTLWVSNMPYTTTDKELHSLFSRYGIVRNVRVSRAEGTQAEYAHIDFEFSEDASSALLATWYQPFVLRGRRLWVAPARAETGHPTSVPLRSPEEDRRYVDEDGPHPIYPPSRCLWVGGLRNRVRNRDVRKMFERYGKPLSIHIVRLRHAGAGAYAHVEFATKKVAMRIMARHMREPFKMSYYIKGDFVDHKFAMVEYAAPLVKDNEPYYKLFTPFVQGDEMDIRALFGPHARNIRKIEFHSRPVVDPSGRGAFIEFATTFQATAAKEALAKTKFNNKNTLILVYAKNPQSRTQTLKISPPVIPMPPEFSYSQSQLGAAVSS